MIKVAIITGSTRPGRKSDAVARWVLEQAQRRGDAQYEIVDIDSFSLPMLDEPVPPSLRQYSKAHTKRWSEAIDGYDAFVFVTPEYNHSTSGALKNAIDFIFHEWGNKAAAFVSYGSAGGVRAVEHLRGIMGEIQVADVRSAVALSLFDDFENFATFKPRDAHLPALDTMLDQLLGWASALKLYREGLVHRAKAA